MLIKTNQHCQVLEYKLINGQLEYIKFVRVPASQVHNKLVDGVLAGTNTPTPKRA